MLHPYFKNYKSTILYFTPWIVLAMGQAYLMAEFYGFSIEYSIKDSLFNFGLYSIIGLGLWYPVQFIYLSDSNQLSKLVNFLGLGAGTVALWVAGGYLVLINLYPESVEYIKASIPVKVVAGIFIFLILTLIYYLIIYFLNLEERRIAEAELRALVKDAELNLLKYKLNPHFLFNSLNSISSLTMSAPDKAQDMIIKLSDYLRYSLDSDKQQLRSLTDELDNVNRYLAIEKIRFGKRLIFKEIKDEKCLMQKVPGMILQPLVENAIKHGVHESIEPIYLEIKCTENVNFIFISIMNNFDPESTSKKGTGTGLKNVRKRLLAIYNRDDLLDIIQNDFNFEVKLKIPKIIGFNNILKEEGRNDEESHRNNSRR